MNIESMLSQISLGLNVSPSFSRSFLYISSLFCFLWCPPRDSNLWLPEIIRFCLSTPEECKQKTCLHLLRWAFFSRLLSDQYGPRCSLREVRGGGHENKLLHGLQKVRECSDWRMLGTQVIMCGLNIPKLTWTWSQCTAFETLWNSFNDSWNFFNQPQLILKKMSASPLLPWRCSHHNQSQ